MSTKVNDAPRIIKVINISTNFSTNLIKRCSAVAPGHSTLFGGPSDQTASQCPDSSKKRLSSI